MASESLYDGIPARIVASPEYTLHKKQEENVSAEVQWAFSY